MVRNVHSSIELTDQLRSMMENTRFLDFFFSDPEPVRTCMFSYFLGKGLSDTATAFDAGWRAHVTEIALSGGGEGMKTAAGLHTFRNRFEEYLLKGTSAAGADEMMLRAVLSSFSKALNTVFCLHDYLPCFPFEDPDSGLPAIVAFTGEYSGISFPDAVIDSGLLSIGEITSVLQEKLCSVPVERVVEATGGRAGLVELFVGISSEYGMHGNDVMTMLDEVLNGDPELASFASAAAVLSPGFSPDEAALAALSDGDGVFRRGRRISLWKGFLVGSFLSEEVRRRILSKLTESGRNELLTRAAFVVAGHRVVSGTSMSLAGSLLARAGDDHGAFLMYRLAAEVESCQIRRAGYFRTAAMFSSGDSADLLFHSAICLYREDMTDEAAELLVSSGLNALPEGALLEAFCSRSCSGTFHRLSDAPPELSPELLQARSLQNRGLHSKAEELLLSLAGRGEEYIPVALVELGDQLSKRGMVEASLNVIRAAMFFCREEGLIWLEIKALFIFIGACNRSGRFSGSLRGTGRLLELVLDSGNTRRLAAVYNLFANSMILQTSYEPALRIYSSSLRALRGRESSLRSVILNNMSVAQRRLFRTDEALGSLMRLVRETVSEGSLVKAGVAYGNMARLFIDLSRFDSARDCLETMVEFRSISGVPIDDSLLFITAQISFAEGHRKEAVQLMEQAEELARKSGDRRRLSLNLLKRGSMLLRMGEFTAAAEVLEEAEEVSLSSNSLLNTFVAGVKLAAARCFAGNCDTRTLLCIKVRGRPEETHRGEQYYYHWKLTGSRQSMTAAAQLLSSGLSHGLHYHSYLHMLHEIIRELPSSLADALPLVHNYPSCDSMKGE